MRQMDLDQLTEMCLPYLIKAGRIEEEPSVEKREWLKNRLTISTTNELCCTNCGSF